MNVRKLLFLSLLITGVTVETISAQTYTLTRGYGVLGGVQRLFGDVSQTRFAPGGEGLLSFRLGERTRLNVAAGYTLLAYQSPASTKWFSTNLVYLNLFMDWEVLRLKAFRPLIQWGVGGFNFEAVQGKRYNDGQVFGGGGFRLFLTDNLAFQLTAGIAYTTGDDLETLRRGGRDYYLTVRSGLIFFQKKERFTVKEPLFTGVEPPPGETADTSATAPASEPAPEAEYIALQNRIEELRTQIEHKNQEIEALKSAIEQRKIELTRLEQQIQTAPPPMPATRPFLQKTGNFKEDYQQALEAFQNRNYREAIDAFEALYNQDPNHRLASNCLYWIGESYFALGDYQSAIDYFARVLNYERSYKRDDALLMSGRAYERLGNHEKALEMYMTLVENYPDSEYVDKANRYLQRIQ